MKVYNSNDKLSDFLDFVDTTEACQEARDYSRALGDITMGEFLDILVADDNFLPDWAFWSVVNLPKVVHPSLFTKFKQKLESSPEGQKMFNDCNKRKRDGMFSLEDRRDES